MNVYTVIGTVLDLAIIFQLFKIHGEFLFKNKLSIEIAILVGSSLMILGNTVLSSIDLVTLVVSTITATAIAIGNYLILREAVENNKQAKKTCIWEKLHKNKNVA